VDVAIEPTHAAPPVRPAVAGIVVTKSEIDSVREWLSREGYPLEYETAREVRRAGFTAWQGLFYEDPETSQPREADVSADEPESPKEPWRPVRLAIECKNNSKPWLVLTSKLTLPDGYGENLIISNVPRGSRGFALPVHSSALDFVFNLPRPHGHSVIQVFAGTDTAYAALQSVTKAARAGISRLAPDQPGISLPLIVLGGSLYQLGYEDDGNEQLELVPWSRVIWHGTGPTAGAVQVDIVTRAHLRAYLIALRAVTRGLAQILRTRTRADRL
jgi:hypothetical protein